MVSIVSTVRDIQRLREILTVLVRHGFGEVVTRTGLGRLAGRATESDTTEDLEKAEALVEPDAPPLKAIGVGERLRLVLQDLGPSFVKLGQILSTRPDIIPEEVITELKKLQDRVAPLEFDALEAQITGELGEELDTLFSDLDRKPLASASIAQVHRAKLKTGEEVVLKIQRPGIKNTIERDIELLYLLAKALENSIPEARIYSPVGMVTEFDRAITAELDFTREADHAVRFASYFADDETARFPKIYREVSSKRVLTMEFLPGLHINKALEGGYEGDTLAKIALRIVFKQIFEHGFFHGDPHPGNLMIMGTPEAPVLAMIDLGLVGRLSPQLRDKTVKLLLAAVQQDSQGVADALYTIGNPTKRIDRTKYEAEVTFLAERYLGKPLKEIEVSLLIRDVVQGAIKYGLEIPPEFLMLARTLMTIEGVGKQLDPDLDVFSEIRPFFVELVKQRYSPERLSGDLLRTAARFGETAGHLPNKVDEILDDLLRGSLVLNARDPEMPRVTDLLGRRIFSGLTVAALIGGGSLLVSSGAGEVPGYIMLSAAGVWLVGHALRAALAARKLGG